MSDYNYKDVYEQWVNNPLFGQETKDELLAIKDDEKEIEERFYCDLVFGTAGLRGIIGAGTNRMIRSTTRHEKPCGKAEGPPSKAKYYSVTDSA